MSLNDRVVEWGATNGANDFNAAKQRLTSGLSQDDVAVFAGASGYNEGLRFLAEGPDVLRDAVFLVDAAFSGAGESTVPNRGTGGSVLDAKYGSTTSSDTNDPLLLTHTGENYVYLPGIAANYLSIPDGSFTAPTTGLDMIAKITPTLRAGAISQVIVGQRAGGQASWTLGYSGTTGRMQIVISSDGTTILNQTTDSTNFSDGDTFWVRIVWHNSDGFCYFYDSPDGVTWTLLATSSALGQGITLHNSTAPCEIGSTGLGTGGLFSGEVHRVIIKDAPDGTTVLDFNADTDITDAGATSFTATSGQTVTVNRATSGRKTCLVTRPIWLFGTDDYLEVADNALLDFDFSADDMSVLIIHRQFHHANYNGWVNKFTTPSPTGPKGWQLRASTTQGFSQGAIGDGSTANFGVFPSGLSANAIPAGDIGLHCIVVDSTVVNHYMNNADDPTPQLAVTYDSTNTSAMTIGTSTGGTDSEVIAVAVWRRALTADEIAAINTYYRTV